MKILLATGGTGGHIFPAIQTAIELRKRGHEVILAGVLGMAEAKIKGLGFESYNINAQGFKDRSLFGVCRFIGSMSIAIRSSIALLRKINPDKVMGFGGYGSFSLVLAGVILRCPTMIHEQNVVPGKANKVLARLVKKVAISFKESAKHFDSTKTVWTGCPCHDVPSLRTREEIYKDFGLNPNQKVVALLGGSQGSGRLNEVFLAAMIELVKEGGIQAVHMTGIKDYEIYSAKYKALGVPVIAKSFISPIEELYAVVDLVIARAGAATISELGAFAIPSVLIPYPFAGNHQRYNADVLVSAQAAILLEQKDLSTDNLISAINQLSGSQYARETIKGKIKEHFKTNAAEQLAEAVERV